MTGKRLALMLALPFAALACASCGSGAGGESAKDDEEAIREVVAASMVASGPEACLEFNTLHMLEMTTGREGDAAVETCEEEIVDPDANDPRKVEVSRIKVDDESATALLSFEGSLFDNQNVRYALVERDGRWKFHAILGFVDFDPESLVMEMGRELMEEVESPQEAAAGSCILGLLEEMGDESLEGLILGWTFESISELVDSCAGQESSV